MARPRQSLTSQLVESMTDRIQAGAYPKGTQLPTEKELIEEFGVSRTVVREAIANLKASGLVATRQGKGAFVLDEGVRAFRISEENLSVVSEVLEALELRIAIESEAAALAARRRSPEELRRITEACAAMDAAIEAGEATVDLDIAFHRAIAQATGNRHFLGLFNYLGEVLVPRARVPAHQYDAKTLRDYLRKISDEHKQIVAAIEAGDSDAARAALRMHLGGSRDRLAQAAKSRG
ncbi:FadR/GntR family transcriptional regulator [Amaricoccus solimangrovi]|uniref:FadR family transcriptional regulator n=1 Tax=Amaricoccus solimangrovi TaxID=2589815 RepID=A0A501WS87_9RHOB|nr:FadR/GntR family transcriptional regulator [Amaricoccus solimangrovi]TPE51702.1 FadR family transcriptional regulator [Amaricoccus solimangrovi]